MPVVSQYKRTSSAPIKSLIKTLNSSFLGNQVITSESQRNLFGQDESFHKIYPPDVIFQPKSEEEIQKAVKICNEHEIPIIGRGVGTSLEGHIGALFGGVTFDFSKYMTKVLDINEENMDVVVQPGVTRLALNAALKSQGLFFPVDPGADATLGGMASTRASGTNAIRYGTMKENVCGGKVVLADGRILKLGGRVKKSSSGFRLNFFIRWKRRNTRIVF